MEHRYGEKPVSSHAAEACHSVNIPTNCHLYEINTRVWLRRFDAAGKRANLEDVPDSYWEALAAKGMDFVWLMGVWKICESTVEKYCLKPGAVRDSFSQTLTDFEIKDVIGSPYAIDRYEINPALGKEESLPSLKSRLNRLGMKLILDFVPNHFSADSSLLRTNPHVFLQADEELFRRDPHTFYKPFQDEDKVFAHGRDPFFPAWEDTVQVNYFDSRAREFMMDTLRELTRVCDGVRCDVIMLDLNEVFANTWAEVLSRKGIERPRGEFWSEALASVKSLRPDFLFLGEVYWDKEWEFQQLGFDHTYDKKLTDRLKVGHVGEIRAHLLADGNFQRKSARFLENHDEERAVTAFGERRSKAAAVIIGTLQGMRFFHDGQFEGKKIRLPVQLGREPHEAPNPSVLEFYDRLLGITKEAVFRKGEWSLLETRPAWDGDTSHPNILAWSWTYGNQRRLVLVNYADMISTCRVFPDTEGCSEELELKDLLNDRTYTRSVSEIRHSGMYIELKNYESHIFAY